MDDKTLPIDVIRRLVNNYILSMCKAECKCELDRKKTLDLLRYLFELRQCGAKIDLSNSSLHPIVQDIYKYFTHFHISTAFDFMKELDEYFGSAEGIVSYILMLCHLCDGNFIVSDLTLSLVEMKCDEEEGTSLALVSPAAQEIYEYAESNDYPEDLEGFLKIIQEIGGLSSP